MGLREAPLKIAKNKYTFQVFFSDLGQSYVWVGYVSISFSVLFDATGILLKQ